MSYQRVTANLDEHETVWHIDLSAGLALAQVWPKRDITLEWEDGTQETIPARTRCGIGGGTTADFSSLFYYILTGQGAPTAPILAPVTAIATFDTAVPDQPWGMLAVCGKWGSAPYWPRHAGPPPALPGPVWVTSHDDGDSPNIATFNLDGTEAAPIDIVVSFDAPYALTVVNDGTNDAVWVLLSNNPDGTVGNSIVRLKYDGTIIDYITDSYLGGGSGIAASSSRVFVLNGNSAYPSSGSKNVSIYNLDGTSAGLPYTPSLGGGGSFPLLVTPTPELWVIDGTNLRRFQVDGTPISSAAVHGSASCYDLKVVGSFVWMTLLSAGSSIYRYDLTGAYVDTLTGASGAHHRGLALVPVVGGDEVWVADRDQQKLWRFSTSGTYLGTSISSADLESFGPLFLAIVPEP